MEIDYKALMSGKSAEELYIYIGQPKKYTIEAIDAALDEMRSRGLYITDDDIATINECRVKKEHIKEAPLTRGWNKNVVKDENAPVYYSQQAIWGFSVFFTTLAGSILLYHNIKKTGRKGATTIILIFGICYTILSVFLINIIAARLKSSSGLPIIFNGLGALVLNYFFWNKYIGKEVQYRKKAIWIPLIIWICICAVFIAAIIYTENDV